MLYMASSVDLLTPTGQGFAPDMWANMTAA